MKMKKILNVFVVVFALVAFFGVNAFAAEPPKIWKKCKACHKSDKEKWTVGPGMKGLGSRVDAAWLDAWLSDPLASFQKGDAEIDRIKSGYKAKKKKDLVEKKLMMPKNVKKFKLKDNADLRKEVIAYLLTL